MQSRIRRLCWSWTGYSRLIRTTLGEFDALLDRLRAQRRVRPQRVRRGQHAPVPVLIIREVHVRWGQRLDRGARQLHRFAKVLWVAGQLVRVQKRSGELEPDRGKQGSGGFGVGVAESRPGGIKAPLKRRAVATGAKAVQLQRRKVRQSLRAITGLRMTVRHLAAPPAPPKAEH